MPRLLESFPPALWLTDGYKWSHSRMEQPGTTNTYSYFESRVGAKFPVTQFVGLQGLLKRYMEGPVVAMEDVLEAEAASLDYFMGARHFDTAMWKTIVEDFGGRLPLSVRAVPEGLVVPVGNILLDVYATDSRCASLVNFWESLLTHVWLPCNTATISWTLRQMFVREFAKTVDDDQAWLIDFMLHDFGYRGAAGTEAAMMAGSAHLVNFQGTDTLPAIWYTRKYYNTTAMVGLSVAASEHSIATALGRAGEFRVTDQLITNFPSGILSVVSDSYDITAALDYYCSPVVRTRIKGRDGKFVVRPDSPRFVGDTAAKQILYIADRLGGGFGYTVNSKGYKVLNPKVGIIYGDGLSMEDIIEAVQHLVANGWAASTCLFGMGGGLLQKHNRDTQRSAFKCAAKERAGKWFPVYKEPLDRTKTSKRGLLSLVADQEKGYQTDQQEETPLAHDLLVSVFDEGTLLQDYTFEQVRANARRPTPWYKP